MIFVFICLNEQSEERVKSLLRAHASVRHPIMCEKHWCEKHLMKTPEFAQIFIVKDFNYS